jgi:hypothetical protein
MDTMHLNPLDLISSPSIDAKLVKLILFVQGLNRESMAKKNIYMYPGLLKLYYQ